MNVSLREVTKQNYGLVCDLDVTKPQEEFVACNMWSLVESFYNEGHVVRAIYLDEEAVGFSCGFMKQVIKFLFGVLWLMPNTKTKE